MVTTKHKKSQARRVWLVILGLIGSGLVLAYMLYGQDVVLYNPKGLIAQEQFRLMMFSTAVMLAVAIPMLITFYFFAYKYRESNPKSKHEPNKRTGKLLVLSLWLIPTIVVVVLTSVAWPATHKLDPHKTIASDAKPLTIQVIALRWKWLFIYPEQGIATVNYVQIPVDTPIKFNLTADEAPMNSFWIPHIGGQLYAMTGHSNQLNLMADTVGDYTGRAAEINGDGFSGMNFNAQVVSSEDFEEWTQDTVQTADALDAAVYDKLLLPSEKNPAAFYANAKPNLYDTVLLKYGDSHNHHTESE